MRVAFFPCAMLIVMEENGKGASMTSLTQRLRTLREDRDYTQAQIAVVLHVGQKTYSDYELGKTRIPIDRAMLLADYYGVSLDYLCGRTDRP